MSKLRMVLAMIVLSVGALGSGATLAAEEETKVIEGGILNFDQSTSTATIAVCRNCRLLTLRVTDTTQIYVNGKKQPFTKDTPIGGFVDTMYTVKTKRVVWFRPLKIRRN